jgi:hypothetical protein
MPRRLARGLILSGLVLFGSLVGSERPVRAGSVGPPPHATATKINISGVIAQDPTDPPYTYEFSLYADGTVGAGTSFTIANLVGVNATSLTRADYTVTTVDNYGGNWMPSTTLTQTGTGSDPSSANYYDISSITWNYAGIDPTGMTPSPSGLYLLGTFDVTTAPGYDGFLAGGYPSLFFTYPITDSYTIEGGSSGPQLGGSGPSGVTLTSVPEPSTAIYAVVGLACWAIRRVFTSRQRQPGCS